MVEKINIEIRKKDLWLFSAIMIFLLGVGYIIAGGVDPVVHGHEEVLQTRIDSNIDGWGGWHEAIVFTNPNHAAITFPAGDLQFGMHSNRNFYFSDTADEGNHLMVISAPNKGVRIYGDLTVDGTISGGSSGGTPDNCVWQDVTWATNEFCPAGKVVQGINTCARDGHRDICKLYCCDIV